MVIKGKRRYWQIILAITVGVAIVILGRYYADIWQKSAIGTLPEVRAVSIKEEKIL